MPASEEAGLDIESSRFPSYLKLAFGQGAVRRPRLDDLEALAGDLSGPDVRGCLPLFPGR